MQVGVNSGVTVYIFIIKQKNKGRRGGTSNLYRFPKKRRVFFFLLQTAKNCKNLSVYILNRLIVIRTISVTSIIPVWSETFLLKLYNICLQIV